MKRFKILTILIALFFNISLIAQTNTTSSGTWTNGSNWTSGVPSTGGVANIYHDMMANNINITWGGHYIIHNSGNLKASNITLKSNGKLDVNGKLILSNDLNIESGSIFNSTDSVIIKGDVNIKGADRKAFNVNAPLTIKGDLKIEGSSEVIFNSNVHIKGEFNMSGNSKLTLKSGDTLIVDDEVEFKGSVMINIEYGAVFIINDEFEMKGNSKIKLDGTMYVDDETEIKGSSKIYGNGSFQGNDDVEIKGSSSIFGSTKGCKGKGCKYGTGAGLPITLDFFRVTLKENIAIIDWRTLSEINNDHFILEQSINGSEFKVVDNIDGGGNSNKELNYSYNVTLNQNGTHYFKLTQVDYDGKSESFDYIYIRYNNTSNDVKSTHLNIYPNPSNGKDVKMKSNDLDNGQYVIYLYNNGGQLIDKKKIFISDEYLDDYITDNSLSKGIYILNVRGIENDINIKKKFVVQ